jgi:hypothetical protein
MAPSFRSCICVKLRGKFASFVEMSKAIYFAIEYVALCGQMYSMESIFVLENFVQYLSHIGALTGKRMLRV